MRVQIVVALLLVPAGLSGTAPAQELVEVDPVAVWATEASLLSDHMGDSAYSSKGDAEALDSFRDSASKASALLDRIAKESATRGSRETRLLFDEAAVLTLHAIRVANEGGIVIDPTVAEEFSRVIKEMEAQYFPDSRDSDAVLEPLP